MDRSFSKRFGYDVRKPEQQHLVDLEVSDPSELLTLTPADAADRRERAKVDRLLATEKLFSGMTFHAHWRSLIGRTVSVAHCTMHDVQPDGRALCAVLDGAAQVADIRLRLASTSPPPVDCSGPKLSVACSVVATGTVLDVGGEAGLAEASISR